jgi:hypothetical protein
MVLLHRRAPPQLRRPAADEGARHNTHTHTHTHQKHTHTHTHTHTQLHTLLKLPGVASTAPSHAVKWRQKGMVNTLLAASAKIEKDGQMTWHSEPGREHVLACAVGAVWCGGAWWCVVACGGVWWCVCEGGVTVHGSRAGALRPPSSQPATHARACCCHGRRKARPRARTHTHTPAMSSLMGNTPWGNSTKM